MTSNHSEKIYDLAVVGGGIAGVAVARDAALRGLSVILFEKNTLGSGTSSKSSKLIHGGIRYLELAWNDFIHLRWAESLKNFKFVFLSLRETHILEKIAPDLVKPIRLFVPIYRGRSRKRLSIYAGTLLYSWLAQATGSQAAIRIFKSQKKALEALPLLSPEGLIGAVEISDHATDDLALVRAVAESARQNGAEIFEQASVQNWKWDKNRRLFQINVAVGAIPATNLAGRHESPLQSYRAKTLVNATGPWIDHTRGGEISLAERYVYPVGGSHVEVSAFLGRSAILEASDGRLFFVIEKNGRARIGTTEWPGTEPEDVRVPEKDIDYLLGALSRYFPSKTWSRTDILSTDAGLRPLAVNRSVDNATYLSREHQIKVGPDGVLYLIGVKLTDHRRAAEKLVDRAVKALGQKTVPSKTAVTPLTAVPRLK